jgi:hypothetical protein
MTSIVGSQSVRSVTLLVLSDTDVFTVVTNVTLLRSKSCSCNLSLAITLIP